MDQSPNNTDTEDLDRLKDLRLEITSEDKSSLVIYGRDGNITLHAENGAEQNKGLFTVMMKALKVELNQRIHKLEE